MMDHGASACCNCNLEAFDDETNITPEAPANHIEKRFFVPEKGCNALNPFSSKHVDWEKQLVNPDLKPLKRTQSDLIRMRLNMAQDGNHKHPVRDTASALSFSTDMNERTNDTEGNEQQTAFSVVNTQDVRQPVQVEEEGPSTTDGMCEFETPAEASQYVFAEQQPDQYENILSETEAISPSNSTVGIIDVPSDVSSSEIESAQPTSEGMQQGFAEDTAPKAEKQLSVDLEPEKTDASNSVSASNICMEPDQPVTEAWQSNSAKVSCAEDQEQTQGDTALVKKEMPDKRSQSCIDMGFTSRTIETQQLCATEDALLKIEEETPGETDGTDITDYDSAPDMESAQAEDAHSDKVAVTGFEFEKELSAYLPVESTDISDGISTSNAYMNPVQTTINNQHPDYTEDTDLEMEENQKDDALQTGLDIANGASTSDADMVFAQPASAALQSDTIECTGADHETQDMEPIQPAYESPTWDVWLETMAENGIISPAEAASETQEVAQDAVLGDTTVEKTKILDETSERLIIPCSEGYAVKPAYDSLDNAQKRVDIETRSAIAAATTEGKTKEQTDPPIQKAGASQAADRLLNPEDVQQLVRLAICEEEKTNNRQQNRIITSSTGGGFHGNRLSELSHAKPTRFGQ